MKIAPPIVPSAVVVIVVVVLDLIVVVICSYDCDYSIIDETETNSFK